MNSLDTKWICLRHEHSVLSPTFLTYTDFVQVSKSRNRGQRWWTSGSNDTKTAMKLFAGFGTTPKSNDLSLYLFLAFGLHGFLSQLHVCAYICSHRSSALPLDDEQAGYVTVRVLWNYLHNRRKSLILTSLLALDALWNDSTQDTLSAQRFGFSGKPLPERTALNMFQPHNFNRDTQGSSASKAHRLRKPAHPQTTVIRPSPPSSGSNFEMEES